MATTFLVDLPRPIEALRRWISKHSSLAKGAGKSLIDCPTALPRLPTA